VGSELELAMSLHIAIGKREGSLSLSLPLLALVDTVRSGQSSGSSFGGWIGRQRGRWPEQRLLQRWQWPPLRSERRHECGVVGTGRWVEADSVRPYFLWEFRMGGGTLV